MANIGIESKCVACAKQERLTLKKPGYNTPSVITHKCSCGWKGRLKVSRKPGDKKTMRVEAFKDGES